MPEPQPDVNDRQLHSPADEPWHDKVLVDAIGYTKGLVAVLDSLSEGFRRRGQELEDQRHRLAILQSERRKILDGRSEIEARIGVLTAERDELRATAEERARELDRLRLEAEQAQAALEARIGEIEELRAEMEDRARQTEKLREVIRSLERHLQYEREAEARIGVLTAERDELRATAEERARELDRLRLEAEQAQAALEARTGEIQELRKDLEDRAQAFERLLQYEREAEARIGVLTAERDELRATAEERARELDRLRLEAEQAQAALEARTGEIQELRDAVQGLEHDRESLTHRGVALEREVEEWRQQASEAAASIAQEQSALCLARQERADAHRLIEDLRQTAAEEQTRNALLEDRVQSQALDISRLTMAIQAVQALLKEIADVLDSEGATKTGEEAWAVVRPILEVFLETLGSANGPAKQAARLAADQASVRRRVAEIVELGQRFLQEREESVRREQHLREENKRLVAQLAAAKPEHAPLPESQPPRGTLDSTPAGGATDAEPRSRVEAHRSDPPEKKGVSPEAGGPSISSQGAPQRRSVLSGVPVECMVSHSGTETVRILRGEIGRINTLGLIGAFEGQFPEGQRVVVRFSLDAELFSFLGRVVRVQGSASSHDAGIVWHHVIRFESMVSGSMDKFKAVAY